SLRVFAADSAIDLLLSQLGPARGGDGRRSGRQISFLDSPSLSSGRAGACVEPAERRRRLRDGGRNPPHRARDDRPRRHAPAHASFAPFVSRPPAAKSAPAAITSATNVSGQNVPPVASRRFPKRYGPAIAAALPTPSSIPNAEERSRVGKSSEVYG